MNLFIFLQFNLFNHIDTIDWIELILDVSLFIVHTNLIELLCYLASILYLNFEFEFVLVLEHQLKKWK